MQKSTITVKSPGRINLIGDHTDYHDGFVLPAAIDKKTVVKLQRNDSGSKAYFSALNANEKDSFDLNNYQPRQEGGWQNYVMGVVGELQKLGAKIGGFDAEFEGNVPIGSGMSSSASLECAFAFGLNELFDLGLEKTQLIRASQMAEHNYVGIKCGIMDQFASMMGKKNQVMLLDCRSLEYQYFPLELGDYELLLLNSKVSHELANSEYNTRREESEAGIAILQRKLPEITHLRDVNLRQLEAQKSQLSTIIFKRCQHVISENKRVLDATKALQNGHLEVLGKLMYESHYSLKNDYQVTCPETDFLVQKTLKHEFILGSRQMGGGFGGCTINIVSREEKDYFIERMSEDYYDEFGIDLTPYSVSTEDGAMEI